MWWILLVVVSVILVMALATACIYLYRSMTALQDRGTGVVMRCLPCIGDHGWRHGILIYGEDHVAFYVLRKLVNRSALILPRNDIHISERRAPQGGELEIMPERTQIVRLHGCTPEVELAMDPSAHAALISWLESRPSKRLYCQGL